MSACKDPEIAAIREMMAGVGPADGGPEPSYAERRARMDAFATISPPPDGCRVTPISLAGRPAERLHPFNAAEGPIILYLHGGGYCLGSPLSHRATVGRLAEAACRTAIAIDYPLAPEAPFPAAVDHALAAWRELIDKGADPARAVFAGDSAGGGLAFALALAARDAGVPLPAALVAVSPWLDLAQSGAAFEAKASSDPMITKASLDAYARDYLAGADPANPLASPLKADLSGLPPVLIQVGGEETLLTDATCMTERLALAGGDVTLRVWAEMIHVWHFFAPQLAAGRAAIKEAGEWIKVHAP